MARLEQPMFIKRYGGQRFYVPASGGYVDACDLVAMARRAQDFTVVDARTGEDVTAAVRPILIEQ